MDDFALERWIADFRRPKKRRFTEEAGEGYRTFFADGRFHLEITRKNLFAWTDNPYYQYHNFVIEGEASFSGNTAYASLGFSFRRLDDRNYYYFLISNRNHFRFDLVFNGNPRILIPWTPFSREEEGIPLRFRLLAHGSHFSFFIDEDWVGEIEDEGIASGGFAWAGQNYGEGDYACLSLHRLSVESRLVEVETAYYRWAEYLPVNPQARLRLAESLYTLGAFTLCLIQMRRLAALRPLDDPQELLMILRSLLGSGLYPEILDWVPKLKEKAPEDPAWAELQGIALYRLNRFLELKKLLLDQEELIVDEPWYWELRGNTVYALGNWEEARDAYEKALEGQPEEPLFWENLARVRHQLRRKDEAAAWLSAAQAYFRREEYDEVRALLPRLFKADPNSWEARILKGKILFQDGHIEEAEVCFAALLKENCQDPSILFLQGLILSQQKEFLRAEGFLLRAANAEPETFIYQYKAAEFLHLQGHSAEPYLNRALALKEEHWSLNLAGLIALEKGNKEEALELLARAMKISPDEADIAVNFSHALDAAGRTEEALGLLAGYDSAETWNMQGNLMVRLKRFNEAVEAYRKALKMEPQNRAYRINCASACLEADRVHEAEEILRLLEEEAPSGEARNLLGNMARLKGEFHRAETAYSAALELEPDSPTFLLNLGELQFQRGEFTKAQKTLKRINQDERSPRALRLEDRLREKLEREFHCRSCARLWRVPKDIPKQGPLHLRGEIPDEAPAGRCEDCGILLCVVCAKPHLSQGRFRCPECGGFLKLGDAHLRFFLRETLKIDE